MIVFCVLAPASMCGSRPAANTVCVCCLDLMHLHAGAVLQLLEQLPAALAAAAASSPAQVSTIPLVYLSPAAADFLATANSCCEYLEQHKQQQVLASGTPPLDTDRLVKSGQLQLLAPAGQHKGGRQASQVTPAATQAGSSAVAAGSGAGAQPMQLDPSSSSVGDTARAERGSGASWGSGGREGGVSSSGWDALVQQVLSLGPCVVFVPLWSMAGGETWGTDKLRVDAYRTHCLQVYLLRQLLGGAH
jgi:hypothetical protein